MTTQAEKDVIVAAAEQELHDAQVAGVAAAARIEAAEKALEAANAIVVTTVPDWYMTEPAALGAIVNGTVSMTEVVAPKFLGDGRYGRDRKIAEITGNTFKLECDKSDYPAGGADRPLQATTYTVMGAVWASAVNPKTFTLVPIGSYTRPAGTTVREFNVTLTIPSEFPDGDLYAEFVPDDATQGEYFPAFCMILDRHGEYKNARYIAVQWWNYAWTHFTNGYHQLALVDRRLIDNTAMALPHREALPVDTMLTAAKGELVVDHFVTPLQGRPTQRAYITHRGNPTEAGNDAYPYTDILMSQQTVRQPEMDGARGEASCVMPLAAYNGRERKKYVVTPWACMKLDKYGTRVTKWGLRNKQPTFYEDVTFADCEIVGTWTDGTPPSKQWPFQAWATTFAPWTTIQDENAHPIGGEQPHPGDVIQYTVDNQRSHLDTTHKGGRLIETRYNGDGVLPRDGPPRLRTLKFGDDFWGVTCDGTRRQIISAERGKDRIVVIDPESGAIVEVFQQGPSNLGTVNSDTVWRAYENDGDAATLKVARQHPCVAPEWVHYDEETDTVYWSSKAQADIRRQKRDKSTPIEVCLQVSIGNNTNYVIGAMGKFGPKLTIGYTKWELTPSGWPPLTCPKPGKAEDGAVRAIRDAAGAIIGYEALDAKGVVTGVFLYPPGANYTQKANTLAAAQRANGTPLTHTLRWEYEPDLELSYLSAMSMGYDELFAGSAANGAPCVRARHPDDLPALPPSAARTRGAAHFNKYFLLVHGNGGNGMFTKIPLPFTSTGQPYATADCDAYMNTFERVRWVS